MRKAEWEVGEFRKFQEIGHDFVEVNEKICRLRPCEDAAPITQDGPCRPGGHRDGSALGHASGWCGDPHRTSAIFQSRRRQAQYQELRAISLLTVAGKRDMSRPYCLCPHCHSGQFPADIELDVENTKASPDVPRTPADETTRRSRGDGQGCGEDGRRDRIRYRRPRAGGDTTRHPRVLSSLSSAEE